MKNIIKKIIIIYIIGIIYIYGYLYSGLYFNNTYIFFSIIILTIFILLITTFKKKEPFSFKKKEPFRIKISIILIISTLILYNFNIYSNIINVKSPNNKYTLIIDQQNFLSKKIIVKQRKFLFLCYPLISKSIPSNFNYNNCEITWVSNTEAILIIKYNNNYFEYFIDLKNNTIQAETTG